MLNNGQQVVAYLGEDRQLYLNNPGKFICIFEAKILNNAGKQIIYITDIPDKFDDGPVKAPPNFEVMGL